MLLLTLPYPSPRYAYMRVHVHVQVTSTDLQPTVSNTEVHRAVAQLVAAFLAEQRTRSTRSTTPSNGNGNGSDLFARTFASPMTSRALVQASHSHMITEAVFRVFKMVFALAPTCDLRCVLLCIPAPSKLVSYPE